MKLAKPLIPFILALFAFTLGMVGLLSPVNQAGAAPMGAGEDGTRDIITPTLLTFNGIARTLSVASGDGHKFANNGETFVEISNAYSAAITATFVTPGSLNGIPLADIDVGVGVGATKIVGPFPIAAFNQPSGSDKGKVYINWSTNITGTPANSVTLAAYKLR